MPPCARSTLPTSWEGGHDLSEPERRVARGSTRVEPGSAHGRSGRLAANFRQELIADLREPLGVPTDAAKAILRASEPFWNALEEAGGLVDSWGGSEFCDPFPEDVRSHPVLA